VGAGVPIPTYPLAKTRRRSVLFVQRTRSTLSMVPRKLLVGFVPEFPKRSQAFPGAEPIIHWLRTASYCGKSPVSVPRSSPGTPLASAPISLKGGVSGFKVRMRASPATSNKFICGRRGSYPDLRPSKPNREKQENPAQKASTITCHRHRVIG
jgi:hypothetical protein